MTVAQANAWHYRWLIPWGGTDNQGLTDASGNPAKRMYAVGQFSRFVQPNYHRIGANTTQSAALISA
jgi:O-glycosyl hydrolase